MKRTMPQSDEIDAIKTYMFLPLILSAFERDRRIFETLLKSPEPYIDLLTIAADKVTKDLTEVRRLFRERGIKVYEMERGQAWIARYMCRGYTGDVTLWEQLAIAEARVLMRKYLGIDTEKLWEYSRK